MIASVILAAALAAGAAPHHITPVAHRGQLGPNEDTIVALRHADKLNVHWENDVWITRDGTPVVMHDVTLKRTVDPASMPPGVTPNSRPINITLSQWKQLRTFGGEPLPTLWKWLRYAGRHHVPGMVEVKYAFPDADRVVGWVNRWHAPVTFYQAPHYFNGTCHEDSANALLRAGATVGLKQNGECLQSLYEAADNNYSYVITATRYLTRAYVAEAHDIGLKVGPFLATRSQWPALANAHVDYILADHARSLKRWLASR